MPIASTRTITLQGATGHLVHVQVDVSQGMVATQLVGRADPAISEGRDRCRTAVSNSGYGWPSTRRVTILLSPADLPKRGSHFDLAIAVGVICASDERMFKADLEDAVFIGELTLDGRLRPVTGVLPMVMTARSRGISRVFVPETQAAEASLVPDVSVLGVRSLAQVVALVAGWEVPESPPIEASSATSFLQWRGDDRLDEVDLADLRGMEDARFALEVAAAGGHHLMLSGPKGSGKTSLAERLPGILPNLSVEEALEVTAVRSLAGQVDAAEGLVRRPPFFAPHHSATRASLLGGGTGWVRPGELSSAHCGVMLLDEFPLFNSDILEALRQPLESGEITISRGEETATFPARGMFVLACNPCPCGNYSSDPRVSRCDCAEPQRRRYRSRISGPITDRIDIVRHVEPIRRPRVDLPFERPEASADVRRRVAAARTRQAERFGGASWRLNAHAPGPALSEHWPLEPSAAEAVADAIYDGELTQRGATRVHRLAWTVADLRGTAQPGAGEVATALALRTGAPLGADLLLGRSAR
ncbi:YifB family Mg chelatase-like AAA ATPase [Nocardioides alcanivorans]|uniref:YifB family Mg chelatase-like AAA ATPase n=1 Tax=Nocardioides alcanivorans TaxID=2897352 RepID=UPI001F3921D9|nr:YifB family Mg chelatase-like AAA ATPase [Nocardioides alcanivorans]